MIPLNKCPCYASKKSEGNFNDNTLGCAKANSFKIFAFYRTAFNFQESFVILLYRITLDGYLQIASKMCRVEHLIAFRKTKPDGVLTIESQYLYDESQSMEENALKTMDKRISYRFDKEGFPTQFVSPFITKSKWKILLYSHLYRHKRPYKYQLTHPVIQSLEHHKLQPTPTNIETGDWVVKCPNNPFHRILINVYQEQWKCGQCCSNTYYENIEHFMSKATKRPIITDWYFNLRNNAKYRNLKLKLHADYNYNLLMGDESFESVDNELFCKEQSHIIPLFTTWQNISYPFNPIDEPRLENQIIARLYKDHFTGREMFLYLYKVQNGKLHHIAIFLKDKGDSLQEKWKAYYTLPEDKRFEEIKKYIKNGNGDFEDVISLVLGN